jgi:hypothetical protein
MDEFLRKSLNILNFFEMSPKAPKAPLGLSLMWVIIWLRGGPQAIRRPMRMTMFITGREKPPWRKRPFD